MKELFFFIRRIVRANTARRFAAGLRRRAEADYVAIVAKEPRLATPLQSLRRKRHGG